MSKQVQGKIFTGDHKVDASPLAGSLWDLPAGEDTYLRREQDEIDVVLAELTTAVPTVGEAVKEPYAVVTDATAKLALIRPLLKTVLKLGEVLGESEARYEHVRENAISQIVDTVRSAAKRGGGKAVLAAFDKTIAYATETGEKAAKTRAKNMKAKAEAEANANATPPTPPPTA